MMPSMELKPETPWDGTPDISARIVVALNRVASVLRAGMWEFALNHPFWLPAGQSPYLTTGLPAGMPEWCAIGGGNSIPRSGGGCPAAENPCSQ